LLKNIRANNFGSLRKTIILSNSVLRALKRNLKENGISDFFLEKEEMRKMKFIQQKPNIKAIIIKIRNY
jgi:hypothetical protein